MYADISNLLHREISGDLSDLTVLFHGGEVSLSLFARCGRRRWGGAEFLIGRSFGVDHAVKEIERGGLKSRYRK
jgi:hypothetical protein